MNKDVTGAWFIDLGQIVWRYLREDRRLATNQLIGYLKPREV